MMRTLIQTEGLSKTYIKTGSSIHVVKDINLSISIGEIVVLIGPSGSGKSTLLNILGTLDTDYSGNLSIDDENISLTISIIFVFLYLYSRNFIKYAFSANLHASI